MGDGLKKQLLKTMQRFRADLHVHTVLSPCAAVEMIPPLIVQTALEHAIQIIAITDHNASANVTSVVEAAAGYNLTVLPGMEMQTLEEVHVLCLFDDLDQLKSWQNLVDAHLPQRFNNPDYFGEQYIVDHTGEFIAHEERLLLNSVQLSIEDCVREIHEIGGLAIPAHVNRQANGLFAMLGIIPVGLPVEALEISRHISLAQARNTYPQLGHYPVIQNGDVHHLDGFLGSTHFWIEAPTISEIRQALRQENGRRMEIFEYQSA